MELIIAELSRYIIVILFALYTFYSYRAFIGRAAGNNEGVFRAQRVLIVMLHLVCSAVVLVEEKEFNFKIFMKKSLMTLLAFIYVIWTIYGSGAETVMWGFILMILGIPIYVYNHFKNKLN